METAIVIPVGGGRADNLLACLNYVSKMKEWPSLVVLVGDGEAGMVAASYARNRKRGWPVQVELVESPKHEPGLDQPRNRGVRRVQEVNQFRERVNHGRPISHVWFLDSDVILAEDAYEAYLSMENFGTYEGVMLGPYDFMPPGEREPMPEYRQDVRWSGFERQDQEELVGDLSAGLACFGGNMVWPLAEFVRVGGFWNELHHGRCEDGELGLRAVACGIPIAFVAGARGWHLWHGGEPAPTPAWSEWAMSINAIDVPKIDARHHWLHGRGLFVVEKDGKRFDVNCKCGWSGNTAEIWEHLSYCVVQDGV